MIQQAGLPERFNTPGPNKRLRASDHTFVPGLGHAIEMWAVISFDGVEKL